MIRMAIQVVLIDEARHREDVHEIVRIDRGELCPEGLGLSLAERKAISGGITTHASLSSAWGQGLRRGK